MKKNVFFKFPTTPVDELLTQANLHLFSLSAESWEEAIEIVKDKMEKWCNTDCNYYLLDSIIAEDGTTRALREDSVYTSEESISFQQLNEMVEAWMADIPYAAEVPAILKRLNDCDSISKQEWFKLMKYAEHRYYVDGRKTFNVLTDQFFNSCYGEYGVTNLFIDDSGKRYIVVVYVSSIGVIRPI